MIPNNADKDVLLLAKNTNQNLNQNTQTQEGVDNQALSVLYITQLEAMFQQKYVSWDGGGFRGPDPNVSFKAQTTLHETV